MGRIHYHAPDLRIGPGSWWWRCRLFFPTCFRRLPPIEIDGVWYDRWEGVIDNRPRGRRS